MALRQAEQLPDMRQAEGFGFFAGIRFGAFDELGAGWVGNVDGEPQLGRRQSQIFVKGRKRADAPVQGFVGRAQLEQCFPEPLHVQNGDLQQGRSLFRPGETEEADEGRDVVAIGPPGVRAFAAIYPALEDPGDGLVKPFHPGADFRSGGAVEQGWRRKRGKRERDRLGCGHEVGVGHLGV